ncbi:methyl-accepting chemotaxis protein [Pseudobacteroides cellulosolvens]|uniref:Methyl-accepting chemotaxis sensory transducer with Cache sensor n=1 Tax=Pseudobacteroides cellulosolvens ATCC 35603 = DSM 2933 TaxID=398512 RepID=A0A0L6JV63_9FIRM|nr:methyl-accepting chemotaxis protein [Pseudobacteroides cellulosolvens]KNY29703.1 methyl-accepting chemotaxis sensory transducer with Cache sensor [Pseudobacteroides cellulosolvens ATCC 35603 = DSM 2933]
MIFIKNMKIGAKITMAVTFIILIASITIGLLSYSSSSKSLHEALESNLKSRALDGAEIVASEVKSLLKDVESITYNTEIQSMNWAIQKNILIEAVKRLGCIRMGITDLTGKGTFTDGSTPDLSSMNYIKQALQGITNITDPSLSKIDNKMVIVIASPIKDMDGKILGILVATHENSVFSQIIDRIKIGNAGYSFAINKQGIKVAHVKNELVINRDNDFDNVKNDPGLQPLVELERKMVTGEKGFGEYFYGGINKLMAFAPIPNSEWSIGLTVPRDEFYSGLYDLRTKVIVITIFFILLGIAGSIFISRLLVTKPIRELVNISNRLAVGDTDINIKSDSNDEIGTLMASFSNIVNNTREQSDNAHKIAEGNLDIVINQRSDKDILAASMKRVVHTLKDLIHETSILSSAATKGELSVRGDASKLQGGYAEIVKGINNTLDAVIDPINEASIVLGSMAVNDYTIEMTGKYQGMLKEFSDKINLVKSRLLSVQDIAIRVSKGDISRLDEFTKIGKRSDNDKLIPSFTEMMKTIQDLMNEVERITNAASEGNLEIRGDISKFEGGYKTIISGINNTMNAIAIPLNAALKVLGKMAQNDYTNNIPGDYKGSFNELVSAINYVQSTLNNVLNEINDAAKQVASGSKQVSDSAQALSQGSTEQASAIEELSASMEEISTQTKQNAVSANQANDLALAVKENAILGNAQMREMVQSMNGINEASSNISKIIKVIDEIAFQTNILALNAAVEAARAGQHGKGFAVVAEEVRNLAGRSANAAKETTVLIEGTIKKVEDGSKIANDTASALNNIVDGVTKATELIGQIATASNEQATGITQINQGITQVSQVTQVNSATSEESAAASEELSSQADLLKEMVGKFKLDKMSSRNNDIDYLYSDTFEIQNHISPPKKTSKGDIKNQSKDKSRDSGTRSKIVLSDNEFGKY